MPGKILTITYGGNTYKLQFCRRTISMLEQSGFVIGEMFDRPATRIPQLFWGAFQMHHRNIRQATTDEIYLSLPNKEKLIDALVELYNEPIGTLLDDPVDDAGKNASWVMG